MVDRSEDADYVAQSCWRNQPAIVSKPEKSNLRRSKVPPQCTSRKNLTSGDPKFGLSGHI